MTSARVERVPADRIRAREFFVQAERFLTDAQTAGLTPESRVTLLHNAAMRACDAILQVVGWRVTSGDDAHVLRLESALDQLDHDTEELLESLACGATKPPTRHCSLLRRALQTRARQRQNSSNWHAASSAPDLPAPRRS